MFKSSGLSTGRVDRSAFRICSVAKKLLSIDSSTEVLHGFGSLKRLLNSARKCVFHDFLPICRGCKYLFIYIRRKKSACLSETSDKHVGNKEVKVQKKIVTMQRFFRNRPDLHAKAWRFNCQISGWIVKIIRYNYKKTSTGSEVIDSLPARSVHEVLDRDFFGPKAF